MRVNMVLENICYMSQLCSHLMVDRTAQQFCISTGAPKCHNLNLHSQPLVVLR